MTENNNRLTNRARIERIDERTVDMDTRLRKIEIDVEKIMLARAATGGMMLFAKRAALLLGQIAVVLATIFGGRAAGWL